jgi:hypothetical protein
MWNFFFHLLVAFISLTLSTCYSPPVTTHNLTTRDINNNTMANAWIPIRRHGKRTQPHHPRRRRARRSPSPGYKGRGLPHLGSPNASRISTKQNIPSSTDNLRDAFPQVRPNAYSQCTTVELAHAKSIKKHQNHGCKHLDPRGLRILPTTPHTIIVSLERRLPCLKLLLKHAQHLARPQQ